jgi:hypothetical protein
LAESNGRDALIYRIIIVCPDGTSVSYEYPVEKDGDIESAISDAMQKWRMANTGRGLLKSGCSIKVEKVE